ncbi:MAG TPA: ribosomal protein L7/L12 [Pyrinomonadaceae bacterium]
MTGGNGLDAKLVVVVAAVGLACFLAGLFVGSRRRGQDGRMIVQQSPRADDAATPAAPAARRAAPGSVNLQLGRDLEQLLSAGRKIEAIKLVRERTGLGLRDAKDAVERLEDLMRKKLISRVDEDLLESNTKIPGV